MSIQSHRDLEVWQVAMDMVDEAYRLSRPLPREEMFGLKSQLRRAAYSVPLNIAEGRGRGTRRDFAHYISMAKGSVMELDTILEICLRQEFFTRSEVAMLHSLRDRVEQMLSKLRSRLAGVSGGSD